MTDAREQRPWGAVLLVCGVALAINLATISRGPTVWQDEVMFADPAINWVRGDGFRTSAWNQPDDMTFAGNSPLYSVLLAGWLKPIAAVSPDAALSPAAVRSLNYLLMTATVLILCFAAWRWSMVTRRTSAVLLAVVLWGGWATTFSYRSGRYDVLGMLLVAGIFLAATIPHRGRRLVVMGLMATLLAWAGLQNLVVVAAVGVLLLALARAKWFKEVAAVAVGSAVGLFTLVMVLNHAGLLTVFGVSVNQLGQADRTIWSRLDAAQFTLYRGDISTAIFMLAAITLLIAYRFKPGATPGSAGPWLGYALLFGLGVPIIVALFGKFPAYYGWMSLFPATLCMLRAGELATPPARRVIVVACLLASCFLPARQLLALRRWGDRDPAVINATVAGAIRADDVAVVDFVAYYPAKRIARWVGVPTHLRAMSKQRRDEVTVVVVDPTRPHDLLNKLGGDWQQVDSDARLRVYRRAK